MKNRIYTLGLVLLLMAISCTPQPQPEEQLDVHSCCGGDIHFPPSKPSSGPGGGG